MVRLIVLGVVGCLLGLGAATGIVVTREKEARAAEQVRIAEKAAAKADSSTSAASEKTSSSLAVVPALPRLTPHAGDSATAITGFAISKPPFAVAPRTMAEEINIIFLTIYWPKREGTKAVSVHV